MVRLMHTDEGKGWSQAGGLIQLGRARIRASTPVQQLSFLFVTLADRL